ncbi:ComEC/Rec2 family competence protein [Streptomyces sp. CRN 30]|uniref:ComEC/Rec2 family competence protein n=1 Tax=Streptomyces sp. CRN 30 TaxID=3075613 RepID=UPI002A8182D9|nr:ComEC/Rec2 family competence protein [Streptomyces sp. CRN 30]
MTRRPGPALPDGRSATRPAQERPRAAVHAASGKRLGAARPRQEGPADLRLVPPALAAWATAALMPDVPSGRVVSVVAGCAAIAGGLLLWRRGRRGEPGDEPRRPDVRGRHRPALAALLLCIAAAAASAGLHGADLRRGPVPELARRYATVTAEAEVTSVPKLTRPRVQGDREAPPAVLIDAELRRVDRKDRTEVDGTEADGTTRAGTATDKTGTDETGTDETGTETDETGTDETGTDGTRTRTPVRLIVDLAAPEGAPTRKAAGDSPWLDLLPTTRVRVVASAAPAATGGDRIAAVLRIRGAEPPDVVAGPSTTQRLAGRLRAGLRTATDDLSPDARALLPGLVVGDTARITPDLDEAFKETDLTHTLAVSGANFTILLALLLGPPGLARYSERRGLAPRLGIPLRTTALLGAGLALGFTVVCGPDPSVLRAAACGGVALLALATGRRRSLIPTLATAVLLLVLYDPWLARSYGFLLSVLATGALLTLAPRWSASLRGRGMPPRLAEALAAAGAAQAVCGPVVTVLSARVSLVGVPCNLLAEFAVAPATVLGFGALVTAPLAMPVAEVLARCAGWPAGWLAEVARTGAALPGAGVDWPGSWTGAALLALLTVGALFAVRRLLRHPWWCGLCAVALVVAVIRPAPLTRTVTGWPPPGWRLVMCDVGQGDAMVLAAGPGAGVVVDAGPDPGLVDHCLRSLGVTRVPLVLLTHFHADHVAGLPGVLRGRSVGAIETTGLEEPADQADSVRGQAAARRITVRHAVAGERRRTGALEWETVWPPASTVPGRVPGFEGPNDASVALLVDAAGLRLLLLGDLEPPAQRALAGSEVAPALEGVDVVKVAHHGSAHQDFGLLRRTAPRVALISAGEDNTYGHPAPVTLAALRAQGATVLRTDRDGALAVMGTGENLRTTVTGG